MSGLLKALKWGSKSRKNISLLRRVPGILSKMVFIQTVKDLLLNLWGGTLQLLKLQQNFMEKAPDSTDLGANNISLDPRIDKQDLTLTGLKKPHISIFLTFCFIYIFLNLILLLFLRSDSSACVFGYQDATIDRYMYRGNDICMYLDCSVCTVLLQWICR